MWENLKNKKIILGSQSPRRKELLENLAINFEIQTFNFDESYDTNLKSNEITDFLVKKKAEYFKLKFNEILIVSDTIVVLDNKILEKPKNNIHAKEMLQKLSNSKHFVYTSVGIKSLNYEHYLTDITKVYFNEINNEEIDFYIKNYSVLDKAGSYGIQDWIGLAKIQKIEGSFFTVMGLPIHLIYEELRRIK